MNWKAIVCAALALPCFGLTLFLALQWRNGTVLNAVGLAAMVGGVAVGSGLIALAGKLGRKGDASGS